MYIKCEDSYLHLLKKFALAIKAVKCLFNIKEGILRCGDDLIFNEDNLSLFTTYKKFYQIKHVTLLLIIWKKLTLMFLVMIYLLRVIHI